MVHSRRSNGKVGKSQPVSDRFEFIKHGFARLLTLGAREGMKKRDRLSFDV
jgi:hypothetical protein